jgi:hypothetical protein
MKKKLRLLSVAILLMAFGGLIPFIWRKTMENNNAYRLSEPMRITSGKGAPYYMIPAGTVLHYQHGFAEGHQLFTIEVYAKGIPAEKISPDIPVESTWLFPIDAEDVPKLLQHYPLSKDDLVRILRAKKMTRDDLAQIVRDWKDD